MAIRLARAFTERSKIVRFYGHFHGWHDHVAFGIDSHFDGTPSIGINDKVAQEIILVPPHDVDLVREVVEQRKKKEAEEEAEEEECGGGGGGGPQIVRTVRDVLTAQEWKIEGRTFSAPPATSAAAARRRARRERRGRARG